MGILKRWVGILGVLATLVGLLALVPVAHAAPAGALSMAGYNSDGQLGNGTTNDSAAFQTIPGLGLATSVSTSDFHTVAALSNGTVWAWGDNSDGQLGDGTTTQRDSPVQVPGLSNVVAVAAGTYHSLALRSDGTVRAWGNNTDGELGLGTDDTNVHSSPMQVPGVSNAVAISAGYYDSFALLANGTVMAWGSNDSGQLGDGTSNEHDSPELLSTLSNIVSLHVESYDDFGLAVRSDGTVMAWGANYDGQLGDGTTTARDTPATVAGLSGVSAVAEGDDSSYALLSNGTLMAWGYNNHGQLGDGTTTNKDTPEAVPGMTGVRAIGAEQYDALAAMSNGSLYGWGYNGYGELGDGTTTEQKSPEQISFPSGVYAFGTGTEDYASAVLEGATAGLSSSSLGFGSQRVGTSGASETVSLTNFGPAPVVVAGETLTGSGAGSFAKTADSCSGQTVAFGGSCSVTLQFRPSSASGLSASLAFSSTAANSLPVVSLSGTGVNVCTVPHLKGLKLSKARKALSGAHCSLGKVKHKASSSKKGRVIKQSPSPGAVLGDGAKVAVTVSSG